MFLLSISVFVFLVSYLFTSEQITAVGRVRLFPRVLAFESTDLRP